MAWEGKEFPHPNHPESLSPMATEKMYICTVFGSTTRGLSSYWAGVWSDKRLKGSQAAFQAVCLTLTRPLTLDATPLSFFLIETRRRRYMSVIRETVRMRLESLDSWREEVESLDSLGIPEVCKRINSFLSPPPGGRREEILFAPNSIFFLLITLAILKG